MNSTMYYAVCGEVPEDTKWEVAHAFKEWCDTQKLSCEVIKTTSDIKVPGSTVLVWGWRIGKRLQAAGYRVLVMERGYIGDRMGTWTSIGVGGLNGRAQFNGPFDSSRLEKYHPGAYMPWNPEGDYILVIGQVPGDQSLEGTDPLNWADAVCKKAYLTPKTSGMPIFYRPHPNVAARGDFRVPLRAKLSHHATLEEALDGAILVVTYSSTTAVQSLLRGKPTISQGECSMAKEVTVKSLADAWEVEPSNRREWAEMLACKQWTIQDMKTGTPFEFLRHG